MMFKMPKPSCLLLFISLLSVLFFSCEKEKKEGPVIVTHSLVKTINLDTHSGDNVGYEFIYNMNFDTIIRVEESSNGLFQNATNFDYSVAGKLILVDINGYPFKEFQLDNRNLVTKEYLDYSEYEWFDYSYDTDGYLSKYSYMSLPDGYLLIENEVLDGNIIKQTEYDITGEVKKIREFTYTNIDNVNNLDPDCFFQPNYLMPAQMFGKSSKKLPDFIEYWDPRSSSPKTKITFSYVFDNKNRVSKIISSEFGHTYTYNYYE